MNNEQEEKAREVKDKVISDFKKINEAMINALPLDDVKSILKTVIQTLEDQGEGQDYGSTCLFYSHNELEERFSISIRFDQDYKVYYKDDNYQVGAGYNCRYEDTKPLDETAGIALRYILRILTEDLLHNCTTMSSLLTHIIDHRDE
jgi:hypothetical protein